MRAYKIFNYDWTCNGFRYEVGKSYEINGNIELCNWGFHACRNLHDCFKYYPCVPWNKIAEVELYGEIKGEGGDKQVASKIKVVKEIPFENIGNIIENDIIGGNDIRGGNDIIGGNNITGLSHAIMCSNKYNKYYLFNKKVKRERWREVNEKLRGLLGDWYPEFNNLKQLYVKSGGEWEKTPIPFAKEIQKEDAWRGMPKKAIEYIRSLPEFNAKTFEEITGIKEES